MPKRRRHSESQPPDRRRPAPDSRTAAAARPAARGWLLALGAAVAIAAAGWWGVRALRGTAAADAASDLQPVASSVPADQPERREAVEVADRLLREYPHSPEALYARGVLLFRFGFNDEAVKTWNACLKLVPDLAPAYEFLGIDAFQRGENDKAIELLRKAVELDPESPAAGLYLGEALNNVGRMDEAIPVLQKFLKVSPHSAEPYFQLGQAYLYLKAYDRAKECHLAALREDPGFAQACYGVAVACERLGQTDLAREYREKHAGMIARHRMDEQRRTRESRREDELQESLARAYVTAGKVCMAHGNSQEAQEFWDKAAAIDAKSSVPDVSGRGVARPGRTPSRSGR